VVDVVVSQGCRPISRPFTITAAQGNVIVALEAPPAARAGARAGGRAAAVDQALLRNGLLIGRAIDPQQKELGRGDFLIRAVMGANPESGAIAVGDRVAEGQRVQFHARRGHGRRGSRTDARAAASATRRRRSAVLICNGRGTRLYDHPHGDVRVLNHALGLVPLAGLFCAGEIGR
jgi:small ligand-binding sensory domain FIST